MYKKTLCLGGSFNPIHHAHLICARSVAEAAGFDRVLLIPSRNPPHKPGNSDLAPATDRLNMCRLAIESTQLHPSGVRFEVTNIEMLRTGPSYTIDTVRELKQSGWPEVNWLIGADMLNYLPKWHMAAELVQEVNFVVMARPGDPIDWTALPEPFRHLQNHVVQAPLIDISSTTIRSRLREGKPIDYLTPDSVIQYINEHKLYRMA